ncbi:MAG: DUF2877 domain-containing protein [Elusimicrobiaceae bacterium]|jgi:hypothetical protein
MRLLSFGDGVLPGVFSRHSSFAKAVNFERDGILVSVVSPQAGGGPVNIVLDALAPFQTAGELIIGRDFIAAGGCRIELDAAKLYNSRITLSADGFEKLRSSVKNIERCLLEHAPEKSLAVILDGSRERFFTSSFDKALLARAREVSEGEIWGFKGLGQGLTPSGDDFITGYLSAMSLAPGARTEPVLERSLGANLLSNTFLRCAARGRYFAAMKNLITVSTEGGEIGPAVKQTVELGSTSGADTVAGFVFYFKMEA